MAVAPITGADDPGLVALIGVVAPSAPPGTRWPHKPASKRTSASRCHHLLKTFCGWRDQQLPDGTIIWRLPDGHTYVTTPGSALLFPRLCAPTGDPPALPTPANERCGE